MPPAGIELGEGARGCVADVAVAVAAPALELAAVEQHSAVRGSDIEVEHGGRSVARAHGCARRETAGGEVDHLNDPGVVAADRRRQARGAEEGGVEGSEGAQIEEPGLDVLTQVEGDLDCARVIALEDAEAAAGADPGDIDRDGAGAGPAGLDGLCAGDEGGDEKQKGRLRVALCSGASEALIAKHAA